MARLDFFLLLATLAGIGLGQLLFKHGARALPPNAGLTDWLGNGWLIIAILLYGVCTLGWVALLQRVPLAKAYPVFALSFVFVPILSSLLFAEQLGRWFVPGSLLILAGVFLVTR